MNAFVDHVQNSLQKSSSLLGVECGAGVFQAWYKDRLVNVCGVIVDCATKFWIDRAREDAQVRLWQNADEYPCGLVGAVICASIEPGTDIPDDVYVWQFSGDGLIDEDGMVIAGNASAGLFAGCDREQLRQRYLDAIGKAQWQFYSQVDAIQRAYFAQLNQLN